MLRLFFRLVTLIEIEIDNMQGAIPGLEENPSMLSYLKLLATQKIDPSQRYYFRQWFKWVTTMATKMQTGDDKWYQNY